MILRLGDVFSRLRADQLGYGWIYLRDGANPTLHTECFLLTDDNDDSEGGVPSEARLAGFPVEGLDTDTIRDCLEWTEELTEHQNSATDLESFIYYWRFDAFLPWLGAPDPDLAEAGIRNLEREFYDSLGPENDANPCRSPGCARGAIQYSVLCRSHHFESIRKTSCLFND